MKVLPDIEFQELKKLATTPGQDRYLAFAELACRTRDNPSIWDQSENRWFGGPLDSTRAPNTTEMEWAFLDWSRWLNKGRNPELKQKVVARLHELESCLDLASSETPAVKYFNAIASELHRENAKNRGGDTYSE